MKLGWKKVGWVVVTVLVVSFCVYFLIPSRPLPVLGEIPPFELVDQRSQPFGSKELQGKVWVADFIFTSCAGACPLLTRKMAGIQDFLSRRGEDGVNLISFSVDPETDTSDRLFHYAETFGADPKCWHFLTGSRQGVEAVVLNGFKISMGQVPSEVGAGFDVVHGERFVLVDRQGRIRSYYQASEQELKSLLHDISRLLKEK